MAVTHSRTEVEADMRENPRAGFGFLSRIPDELLEHEWAIFKGLEFLCMKTDGHGVFYER